MSNVELIGPMIEWADEQRRIAAIAFRAVASQLLDLDDEMYWRLVTTIDPVKEIALLLEDAAELLAPAIVSVEPQ